jgi:hypothetical protein
MIWLPSWEDNHHVAVILLMAILQGYLRAFLTLVCYQIFHNYFREHRSLGNHTPIKILGIKIDGEHKWITVIQNASTQSK